MMSTMPTPPTMRLLILEDAPEDAELEERALRNAGILFQVRRVSTRAGFLDALDSFIPNLIISDYHLPDIDGLTAVRLVRQRDAELPILLVTGVLEDEEAVEVVKAGATDYVRKDRLARLPIAVTGALAAAATQRERREALLALQQSAREIEDLYNSAPCGYHSVDGDLTIVSMNATELFWLGYRRSEVVGKMRIVDLLTPDSATKVVREALPRLIATGEVHDLELEFVRKDGTIFPVLFNSASVTNPDGSFVRSRTSVYDISRLKAAEQRERMTSHDLQNVLYSSDVATLFLDANLNIRLFTPTTNALFDVTLGDVGRPLADLTSMADDGDLLTAARTVLQTRVPMEREIETQSGAWYIRRISPSRNRREGVVITFVDITERRRVADELEAAKRQAEQANAAKSRFLAAASHDIRQPLQTLVLLQGMLEMAVEGERAKILVARLDDTLSTLSGMLDSLLDINQIEAGTVRAAIDTFPINDLLHRLRDEFSYPARAKGLALHVVPCGLSIRSDPRLLEQMIRNLLSNALKYTRQGKVLLGCRRHNGKLSIQVWDTGIGIPTEDLQAIFEEFRQLDNPARERNRGFGLGLSIVQRLGNLLGHQVSVRSHLGKGSVFAIEVMLQPSGAVPHIEDDRRGIDRRIGVGDAPFGAILVIEDDPEVCEVLGVALKAEGHSVVTAPDGIAALELVVHGEMRPASFLRTTVCQTV
jgi:PAS domain S-box-containing protein